MRYLLGLMLGLLLCGCGEDDFDVASELASYRVIGIMAEHPELNADTLVTTLEVVDFHPTDLIEATPRPKTTYSWRVCLLSAGGITQYACLDPDLEFELESSGAVATLDVTDYIGSIPEDRLAVGHEVWVKLTAVSGDETVEVVRSVTVSDAEALNKNPTLSDLRIVDVKDPNGRVRDGAPVVGDTLELAFTLGEGASETYTKTQSNNGELESTEAEEALLYTWYATSGTLDRARGIDDTYTNGLSELESPGPLRIIAVVRDGRGGFGITTLDTQVLPAPE